MSRSERPQGRLLHQELTLTYDYALGKVAGTFWIPAHLRGTTEEGIVVSDYQVGAPKPESTA